MYCGIDVAKNKSSVCILNSERKVVAEFEIEHNKNGFEFLAKYLTKDTKIGMEVTGNYSKTLNKYLGDRFDVSYLDSYQLKNFANMMSPTIKNDKIDAKLIANYLFEGYRKINPTKMNELGDLCKIYKKTLRQLTRYKCMFKDQLNVIFPELEKIIGTKSNKGIGNLLLKYPTPREIATKSPEQIRKALIGNLKSRATSNFTLEYAQKLKELAQDSVGVPEYPTTCFRYTIKIMKFYQDLVKEIKESVEKQFMESPYARLANEFGYNTTSLAMIVSEIGDIRRFENYKKFVSYCGLGVSEKVSGTSIRKKGKITKRGNDTLRHNFYMLCLVHLRYKTEYAKFYQRLVSRGKHKKKCMVAMARKLAVKAYFDLKKCHE